ncbi:type II toxin-antitoxin system RelE/ParE family toxin [Mucilaginibacter jinjuensis]|uniref:Plasmid stabilization system protein ParE n=1 Tax=Mucilaginibacter jinjuensis TaxID=1176721 RepID=A0ABY7T936_9SPHI|nr:hypothetical protein [Mucilaginibacter jinjuensis]WCT13004.1 hypothetical protein PQO05_03530 [Mucilaginibacter jinjuensis]
MKFEIVFSDAAHETFTAIQSQILDKWGKKSVIKFEKRVLKILEIISVSPFIYEAANINVNVRKASVHKNCSCFYKIGETSITVLFFWDNRQEPM